MNSNTNSTGSSSVKGDPTSSDMKTLPLSKLKQMVIDKIRSYTHLSEDYREFAVGIFKPLKFDRQTYINMITDKNFLQKDDRLYSVKKSDKVKEHTEISERTLEEVAKGFNPDNTKPFFFGTVFMTVPGPYQGTVPGLFATSGDYKDNPHWATSLLKWYLSCLLVHFDLTANSISGKKWLNHTGKGPNVITGAFDWNAISARLEVIMETGIPVIMVVERHQPGFHFGDMRCYYCDPKGRVKGISHGSDHYWYDVNDDLGLSGQIGTYKYHTVATFGNQRIIFMRPGVTFAKEPYVPRAEKAWQPLSDDANVHFNPDPPSPSYNLGLYDLVEETGPKEVILRPKKRLLDNIEPDPPIVKFVNKVKRMMSPWKVANVVAAAGFCVFAREFDRQSRTRIGLVTGISLLTFQLIRRRYKEAIDTPIIKLAVIPMRFTGRYKKQLEEFYWNQPIDPDDHLPVGFYYYKDGQLIQVQQVGDCANYTNVWRFIIRFTMAMGFSKQNAPAIYEECVPHTGPLITKPGEATFHVPLESTITRITSACKYKVVVKDQNFEGVRLLTPEKYRQFIASKITKNVVAASASNRVCCGGKVSQLTEDEHFAIYIKFWNDHKGGRNPSLPRIPDITSYSGAKRRKYEAVLATLGSKRIVIRYLTFMKIEALDLASFIKKAVRLISPNTPIANVAFKNFFHWFEKVLLSFTSAYGHYIFAKGRCIQERWTIILHLKKQFKFCVPIDFKTFDTSHRNQAFTAECRTYGYLGLEEFAVDALKSAKTKGVIQHSIPMRHSGDLFTGSGNCLAVGSALSSAGLENFTFFCDGDDTLLFMDDLTQMIPLKQHLTKLGYTITDDPAIDLSSPDWEIEFCHMFYSERGYYLDAERMLNRFSNIIGVNDDALAKTILGKMQALSILEAAGVDFGVPIAKFIRLDECSDRDKIVMSMYQGMENYLQEKVVHLDILGPEGGLAGRILGDFVKYDIALSKAGNGLWRKAALKIVKHHLKMERANHDFEKGAIARMQRVETAISKLHLQALTPVLDDMYRELFVRMHDLATDDYDRFWSKSESLVEANQALERYSIRIKDSKDSFRRNRH